MGFAVCACSVCSRLLQLPRTQQVQASESGNRPVIEKSQVEKPQVEKPQVEKRRSDSLNDAEVPEGMTGVLDGEGEIRGYVRTSALQGVGFSSVDLGSGKYEVSGLEVTDASGSPVGYTIEGLGFVDLATALNPEAFDAAMAAYEQFVKDHAAQTEEHDQDLETKARPPNP